MLVPLAAVLCGLVWGMVHGHIWLRLNIPWMTKTAQYLQGIRKRPNRRTTVPQPTSFSPWQQFLGSLLGTAATGGILAIFASDLSFLALYSIGLFAGFSPAFIKTYWRQLALVGVLLVVGVTGFQLYDEYGRGEPVGSGDGDSGASNQSSGTKGERSGEGSLPPPSLPPPPPPLPPLSSEPGEIILRGVPFEFNARQIQPEFLVVLNETVRILQEKPDVSVLIEGHTDAVGSGPANLTLSKKRAEAVRNYLVGQGVAAERLHVAGRGESDPLAPNTRADGSDDPQGRAINRRVELSVE